MRTFHYVSMNNSHEYRFDHAKLIRHSPTPNLKVSNRRHIRKHTKGDGVASIQNLKTSEVGTCAMFVDIFFMVLQYYYLKKKSRIYKNGLGNAHPALYSTFL
jgi:hypothetical protein